MCEEDEQHAKRENIKRGVARQLLLERQLGPLEVVPIGQVGASQIFHDGNRLPAAHPGGGGPVDLRGIIEIVAVDPIGPGDVFQFEHRPQRHDRALAISCFDLRDVFSAGTIRRVRLRHHAEGATEIVEVVDVDTTEVNLQRLEHVSDGHVLLLEFRAIDIRVQLRHGGAESGDEAREPIVLARLFDQLSSHCLQILRRCQTAAILHLHAETTGGSDAAHRRGWEHHNRRLLHLVEARHRLTHDRACGLFRILRALIEWIERDEHRAGVGSPHKRNAGSFGE